MVRQICLLLILFSPLNSGFAAEALIGDIVKGQEKAKVCVACHGADGNSVVPAWPKIAGQGERYLIKELKEYRKGEKGGRFDPSMFSITQSLTDQDIADLAAFFTQQVPKLGVARPELLALGEKLYRGGNPTTGVPACGPSCHDIRGEGLALAGIPRISGQHPEYTLDQLKKFRQGARKDDVNNIMQDIAKKMTDEEMQAVSNYVAGLH